MTKRKAMTPARRRAVAERHKLRTPQGAILALERGKVVLLATGKAPVVDHVHQLAFDGPEALENLQPLSEPENKTKTKADAQARGKVRRLSGANKPRPKHNWPTRKIPQRVNPWGRK